MNAVLLAGDRSSSRPLCGQNKAFLLLEGWPLLVHVLAALNEASQVDAISIIGPQKQIMEVLEKALPVFLFSKKIEVLEQKESLIENIQYAYDFSIGSTSDTGECPDSPPILFLPSDIPMVTPEEIDAFIACADMDRYDYCIGVAAASHLEQFYPTALERGIKMAYLYLMDQAYRMNNLHIARLGSLAAAPLFQKIYHHRYQKSVWNRLQMIVALLLSARGTKALSMYLRAQAATFFMRGGLTRFADFFRRSLVLDDIEHEFSRLFQMRLKVVEINMGGAALDIDDERTYHTLSSVFLKWHDRLSAPARQEACPFKSTCPQGVS